MHSTITKMFLLIPFDSTFVLVGYFNGLLALFAFSNSPCQIQLCDRKGKEPWVVPFSLQRVWRVVSAFVLSSLPRDLLQSARVIWQLRPTPTTPSTPSFIPRDQSSLLSSPCSPNIPERSIITFLCSPALNVGNYLIEKILFCPEFVDS